MKSNILSLFTIGAAMTLALCGCDESFAPASGEGQVSIQGIGVSGDAVSARAEYDVSGYMVRIYNADDALVSNWRFADMPEIFSLPAGTGYYVTVESHQVKKAAWDEPLFTGRKEFDIEKGKITDLGKITCTFASLKVTIEYTDELLAAMGDDARVTVRANHGGELVYTPGETRAGYFEFAEGSNTISYNFTGQVNGVAENFNKVIDNVEAGQHHIIKISLRQNDVEPDPSTGRLDGGINVDSEVVTEDVKGSVPTEEDSENPTRPGDNEDWKDPNQGGGEDPNPPTPPVGGTGEITFTSELQFDTPMNPEAVADQATVDIYCEKGIKNLKVKISTTSEEFVGTLEDVGVPMAFDLAHPVGNEPESLGESLNLAIGDQVLNQHNVPFDIRQFVPLLVMYPGTHTFELTVVDNDGTTKSAKLVFIV